MRGMTSAEAEKRATVSREYDYPDNRSIKLEINFAIDLHDANHRGLFDAADKRFLYTLLIIRRYCWMESLKLITTRSDCNNRVNSDLSRFEELIIINYDFHVVIIHLDRYY